jgi:hypothetical protein
MKRLAVRLCGSRAEGARLDAVIANEIEEPSFGS